MSNSQKYHSPFREKSIQKLPNIEIADSENIRRSSFSNKIRITDE